MRNLFFGEAIEQLYGVYGPPGGNRPREQAVLLCQPLGDEYMYAHRALSQIAAGLSGDGFHVLRFDYYATGDSAGETGAGSVAHWLADVHTAAAELRELSGLAEITLFGLRAGATLAAIASRDRDDIDKLVLWDPLIDAHGCATQFDIPHVTGLSDLIAPAGRPLAVRVVLLRSGEASGCEPADAVGPAASLEIRHLPAIKRWGADVPEREPLMLSAEGLRLVLGAVAGSER